MTFMDALSTSFLVVFVFFCAFYSRSAGRRDTAATGLRGAHAGIVVLDSAGKVLYRWVSASENGEALVPAVVDLHG